VTDAADWFVGAFGERYLKVYAHRDEASAGREVRFVAASLGVGEGTRLLDAGCGAGRHSRALAALGPRVVGIDLSAPLLAEARGLGGGPAYARADLRWLPFVAGCFDHVASLFTTFGYFDDAGNRQQLGELRRVLRPGGGLVLDFLNADRVRSTLVPASERVTGSLTIRERRRIRDGRVEKDVEVTGPGEAPERWTESVALYDRAALESLLRDAGFAVRATYGDLAGGSWSADSARVVVRAEAT